MEEEKEYLNIEELAKLLGINKKLASKLTHQKGFPCIRFGRRVVIDKSLLQEYFKNNSNKFIK